jgi:putative modified peptide
MGQATMQTLADRLTNDPTLRAEFQRDPEAAAASAGIELDDSDREALRSENWAQMADEELATRVTKGGGSGWAASG